MRGKKRNKHHLLWEGLCLRLGNDEMSVSKKNVSGSTLGRVVLVCVLPVFELLSVSLGWLDLDFDQLSLSLYEVTECILSPVNSDPRVTHIHNATAGVPDLYIALYVLGVTILMLLNH